MHLKPKYINIILNIFLGAAWAVALYGLINGFIHSYGNFLIKIISAVIHSFVGLFLVIVIELIFLQFKKYEICKENNKLLKELNKK